MTLKQAVLKLAKQNPAFRKALQEELRGKAAAGRASGKVLGELSSLMNKLLTAVVKHPGYGLSEWSDPKKVKAIQNTLVYAASDRAKDIEMEAKFGPKGGGQYQRGPGGRLVSSPPPMSMATVEWMRDTRDAPKYTVAWKVMAGFAQKHGAEINAAGRIR